MYIQKRIIKGKIKMNNTGQAIVLANAFCQNKCSELCPHQLPDMTVKELIIVLALYVLLLLILSIIYFRR